jgi:hypothetical protein
VNGARRKQCITRGHVFSRRGESTIGIDNCFAQFSCPETLIGATKR